MTSYLRIWQWRNHCKPVYIPPRLRAVFWATSRFLAIIARWQPFRANNSATAFPIPRDPPKTAQILPILKNNSQIAYQAWISGQTLQRTTTVLVNIMILICLQHFVMQDYKSHDFFYFIHRKIKSWSKLDTTSTISELAKKIVHI